jgi:hypothetical protein
MRLQKSHSDANGMVSKTESCMILLAGFPRVGPNLIDG